jgi:hypothetical protein
MDKDAHLASSTVFAHNKIHVIIAYQDLLLMLDFKIA